MVGTVSTPGLSATSLATSMRRWRLTSAATVDSAADQRSGVFTCWRGNAAGLGGWTYMQRLSLSALQPTGMGFFGLYGSTAALSATLTLAAVTHCIGIGFQRGTHTNWQLVNNGASGSPQLTDLGASFPVASLSNVLTLTIHASAQASSIFVRVVEEVSGAVIELEAVSRPSRCGAVPEPAQLPQHRRHRGSGLLRQRRRLPRDRLLTRQTGGLRRAWHAPAPGISIPQRTDRHDPTTPRCGQSPVRPDLEAMLERAAAEGARRALSDVGLGGVDAVLTIHDMRSLLECIQFVRKTAVQTAVHVITTGALIALLTGIAVKLRWFGPSP